MSSLARRYRNAGAGLPDPGELMPPDLRTMVPPPFGDQQRNRLGAWLREGGWPRGNMEIAELEGYLVALIAWPVDIPAGAWLPPVWAGRGWRVPDKIAASAKFQEFVGLLAGFMGELDRGLARQESRFESSVLRSVDDRARVVTLRAWGKGFMLALTMGSQGLKWRSESAVAAVRVIAANTSESAASGARAVENVASAVRVLMKLRGSRGPLGPLEENSRNSTALNEP